MFAVSCERKIEDRPFPVNDFLLTELKKRNAININSDFSKKHVRLHALKLPGESVKGMALRFGGLIDQGTLGKMLKGYVNPTGATWDEIYTRLTPEALVWLIQGTGPPPFSSPQEAFQGEARLVFDDDPREKDD